MNYVLFYSGSPPNYINDCIDSIISTEKQDYSIFYCGDVDLKRNDIIFINKNIIKSNLISKVEKLNYFKNDPNPLWLNSFLRIFYILEVAKYCKIDEFIHFDCDVLIFKPYREILLNFKKDKLNITPVNELFLNFSYSFIDNLSVLETICFLILEILEESSKHESKYYNGNRFNEMNLLNIAYIKNPNVFSLLNILPNEKNNYIFDPGSYGQYIGGVHNKMFSKFYINEEHYVGRNIIKNKMKIKFKNGRPIVIHNSKLFELVNLHVHSKKLKKYRKIEKPI